MKKIRLAYLIFGTFLLLYLFLYNPKQSLINFQSYISNFDAEKTMVGRFVLAPLNKNFIFPSKIKYYCGVTEIDKTFYDECFMNYYHPLKKKKSIDYNKYFVKPGPPPHPRKFDSNKQNRKELAVFETYVFLVLSFILLWLGRFRATKDLYNFYKKI
jgi:hypothetical protein